jgi:Ni/Co efflux regulator RcnB
MRNFWIAAGLAAIVAAPSLANAGTACRQERKSNETAGTVIGAIAGGLLGNTISHGRDRGLATAAGAVGGAYVGNRIAASSTGKCPDGYVAYEDGNGATDRYGRPINTGYQQPQQQYTPAQARPYDQPTYRQPYQTGNGYDGNRVEQGWNRDGEHHDWDRGTFDREYGQRGAEWDHRWNRGERLPDGYAQDQRYVVNDYRHHHLPRPSRGYHWVRYGSSYTQVRDDGYVGRTVYNSRY